MNVIQITWKNMISKKLSSFLSILLIAFGSSILSVLLLASHQISSKLDRNSKDIDLVVGAKGSPLQLILSSIYYIDFPTGNIPLEDAKKIMQSPYVKKAVPLALGDNYNGTRIVGTDTNFIALYGLTLQTGSFWSEDFQTTIGADVAIANKLKVGDSFYGAHGLSGNSDIHKAHAYKVAGILNRQDNVTDNLILTNISSVWKMHDPVDEVDEKKMSGHNSKAFESGAPEIQQREITSILIQYRSPMSVVMFPRMVNAGTNMQSASPAMESTRLFSLIGVGIDTLQWFAGLIMAIAAISVFVNLYNSLKERSYDLAIMRVLGASRGKLFLIVISEGIILTFVGTIMGILLGHIILEIIAHFQENGQAKLTGALFITGEYAILVMGLGIGILAAILPAVQAYRANISKILGSN